MFQAREPQESLWQSEFLIMPRKAKLMRRSWAEVFRNEALVLIEEERFAPMYSPDMGRPNRAVQTVLGVLVLKEMFDLTDMEALEELEFNLLWHHALRLEMEEAHLAQKTLHNFRVRLMEHEPQEWAAPSPAGAAVQCTVLHVRPAGEAVLQREHVPSVAKGEWRPAPMVAQSPEGSGQRLPETCDGRGLSGPIRLQEVFGLILELLETQARGQRTRWPSSPSEGRSWTTWKPSRSTLRTGPGPILTLHLA